MTIGTQRVILLVLFLLPSPLQRYAFSVCSGHFYLHTPSVHSAPGSARASPRHSSTTSLSFNYNPPPPIPSLQSLPVSSGMGRGKPEYTVDHSSSVSSNSHPDRERGYRSRAPSPPSRVHSSYNPPSPPHPNLDVSRPHTAGKGCWCAYLFFPIITVHPLISDYLPLSKSVGHVAFVERYDHN